MNHPERCVACGASPREDLTLRGGQRLLVCPACGLGWWRWDEFDPAAFYDRAYFQSDEDEKGYSDYAALEPGMRRVARARLNRIERHLARDSARSAAEGAQARAATRTNGNARAVFDIGCAAGYFLDEARRRGWRVRGSEVSAHAAGVALARGLDVANVGVEAIRFEPGAWDAVTMWDVIEHLRDPQAALATASGGLRPGGVLALSTGNLNALCARWSGPKWHLFSLPEHLFFFTPDSLRRMLPRVGLRVVHITNEVSWSPVCYLFERLAKMFGSAALARAGAGLRRGRLGRVVVPVTLFDVMGVYAVRVAG